MFLVALVASISTAWAQLDSSAIRAFDPASQDSLLPSGAFSPASPLMAAPENCPPCFNCLLPAFPCSHFSTCNQYDGRCSCPPGFGGDNCSVPGKASLLPARKNNQDVGCLGIHTAPRGHCLASQAAHKKSRPSQAFSFFMDKWTKGASVCVDVRVRSSDPQFSVSHLTVRQRTGLFVGKI